MTENKAVQISSGRYYQGRGALAVFPEEVQAHGESVLIITDRTVYPKVRERVEPALRKVGIRFEIFWFDGFCAAGNYEAAARAARRMKAAVVAGIGGGRIMDAAKIASDLCRVRSITVPTSAATCAATALLAVYYTDDGHFLGNYWPAYVPSTTIADLDVIVSDCPVRYNAAGIIDAMAKMPEITITGAIPNSGVEISIPALPARGRVRPTVSCWKTGRRCWKKCGRRFATSRWRTRSARPFPPPG
ncbi:iron-containing alcohol dehydrogenase [Caproicibacter sp.]|uniref:iron-containing alcohol dehydrogenase n=1 Tax=Caproicibacter sp. TaxID=2814884 RepID=UPI00398943F1